MGESLIVQLILPSCVININGVDTIANLMLLEMMDFEVILGIDWFASCHATVDCYFKAVKFDVSDGPSFIFWGDSCLTPANLISFMSAMHLMNKGNEGSLDVVLDVEAVVPSLNQVPMVREFLDVFHEELHGMSPDREIEFCIDLALCV